jgi:hypothetical protein
MFGDNSRCLQSDAHCSISSPTHLPLPAEDAVSHSRSAAPHLLCGHRRAAPRPRVARTHPRLAALPGARRLRFRPGAARAPGAVQDGRASLHVQQGGDRHGVRHHLPHLPGDGRTSRLRPLLRAASALAEPATPHRAREAHFGHSPTACSRLSRRSRARAGAGDRCAGALLCLCARAHRMLRPPVRPPTPPRAARPQTSL